MAYEIRANEREALPPLQLFQLKSACMHRERERREPAAQYTYARGRRLQRLSIRCFHS